MTKEEFKNRMNGRKALYTLLSHIFCREMDGALLEQLRNADFPEEAGCDCMNEGFDRVKYYLHSDVDNMEEELAADFASVFIGAGKTTQDCAFPYESVYTSPGKLMMQDAWEEITKIYAEKSLAKAPEGAEIEDHIGTELEFVAHLCGWAAERDDRLNALKEQYDFIKNHIFNWIPQFVEDVKKFAETDYYKGMADILYGVVKADMELLEASILSEEESQDFSCSLSDEEFEHTIQELLREYVIYAPKRFPKAGANDADDLIRFAKIEHASEIVWDHQTHFSSKEAYYPVTQTMIKFKDDECFPTEAPTTKKILILARPCDLNGVKRLDKIYLENGGYADGYYGRLRYLATYAMIECKTSFEHCFCVSMGTNRSEDYAFAVRKEDDGVKIKVREHAIKHYFHTAERCDFEPEFVTENVKKMKIPHIETIDEFNAVGRLEFWNEYNDNCIGCGGCNTVCPTCSCFDTLDIIYHEGSTDGERRRTWTGCMLDSFTRTAGDNRFRKTPGENMRFKVLHKMHDYNRRFGGEDQMCVGCGRCDMRCSKNISFFDTAMRMSEEIEKMKENMGNQANQGNKEADA